MQLTSRTNHSLFNSSFIPTFPLLSQPQSHFIENSTRHKLHAARRKLQATDGPEWLNMVSYLRIVCSVMQRELKGNAEQYPKITYSKLMKSLLEYDTEWWKQCTVTAQGDLTSSDTVIHTLLSAVTEFAQSYPSPLFA